MSDWFWFEMPGQPPTWNSSYRIVRQSGTRKDGSLFKYSTLAKTRATELYQEQLAMVCRTAKPTGFAPKDKIIISYKFRLDRDMDVDNTLKAMNDAIADALGVNDRVFLVATPVKLVGSKNPSVTINVYDEERYCIEVRPR